MSLGDHDDFFDQSLTFSHDKSSHIDVVIAVYVDNQPYAILLVVFSMYDYDSEKLNRLLVSPLGITPSGTISRALKIDTLASCAQQLEDSTGEPIVAEFAEYLAIMGYVPITFKNAWDVEDPRLLCYNFGKKLLIGVAGEVPDAEIGSFYGCDEYGVKYDYENEYPLSYNPRIVDRCNYFSCCQCSPRRSILGEFSIGIKFDTVDNEGYIAINLDIGGIRENAKRMLTASKKWNPERVNALLDKYYGALSLKICKVGEKESIGTIPMGDYANYSWDLEHFLSYFQNSPEYLDPHTPEEFTHLFENFGIDGTPETADPAISRKLAQEMDTPKLNWFGDHVVGAPAITLQKSWSWRRVSALGFEGLIAEMREFRDEVCSALGINWHW